METKNKITFSIEINRIIELLATQIYPTTFALLRENVQNSYDAVLQRIYRGDVFDPVIDVTIEQRMIRVSDNGIGMTQEDLVKHYWRAGSSSKNTDDAKKAGVVGTFGIGAMANFGIADTLTVETESSVSGERTKCFAEKATLSVTEDCILFDRLETLNSPGTTVTASLSPTVNINIADAVNYITSFVSFLSIKVNVNGQLVSRRSLNDSVPGFTATWSVIKKGLDLGDSFLADVTVFGAFNGDLRVQVSNIFYGKDLLEGELILRQGISNLRTFRSGFGLATAAVSSVYQFGGVANFLFLKPTAGREALTTDSLQMLQRLTTRVDEMVSLEIGNRPESDFNSYFINWAASRARFDLCNSLKVRFAPNKTMTLKEVRDIFAGTTILSYDGNDPRTIDFATEDRPILLFSQQHHRKLCEIGYLTKYCKTERISHNPTVLATKAEKDLEIEEQALAFKISSVLSSDYFLDAKISYGTISHGLSILVLNGANPCEIYIDPSSSTIKLILQIYHSNYLSFDHMVKDFVRNVIFEKIRDLVPSATRQGADAFLKTINRTREVFEYDTEDIQSLRSIWQDYLEGKVDFQQASSQAQRLVVRSHQVIDTDVSGKVKDIMPDVIQNEAVTQQSTEKNIEALPPIQRLDVNTPKKILTIEQNEPGLKGYRCFLALTDKIKEDRGHFFLQPHKTAVVWGGQKALFIFQHHSDKYGLYYDLQTQNILSQDSGGGSFETCTIVMGNRIFIPIPPQIEASFIPVPNEKKRFEVKCDILYIDN
jgi:molecular chaperone HtpG